MAENEFSEVISSAQKRAGDRAAQKAAQKQSLLETIKSKQEVLHSTVNRTLHQAWRDLEAAGVKAAVNTSTDSRGDWKMSLRVASEPALVFTVQAAMGAELVYSREDQTEPGQPTYNVIVNATPVEIARIVAEYLAETIG